MTRKSRSAASGRARAGRSAARLAAVQALYQIDLTGEAPNGVVAEFQDHRLGLDASRDDKPTSADVDEGLFNALVHGASSRRAEIDALVAPALAAGWTLPRLEIVLRATLRAACFELLALTEVPARTVIDEYVTIAHMFFAGREPAFVNGILDRLARRLRPDELADLRTGDGPGDDQGA